MKKKTNRYIPYGKQNISKTDIAAVGNVLESDFITQGSKVREFENALCSYTGAKYAVSVSSGTAALHIACLAAGVKKNSEVITSPMTFIASANCTLYCGGKPIFADIQDDTVNISPEEIKKSITKKTKAVIPVHFAGHPCDMVAINKIAKKHNLTVIEDACHALGAEYKANGKWFKIGSCKHSDMAVFSFHPVKSITTGEGGAILTNRADLYRKLLTLRSHGVTKDHSQFKSGNSKHTGDWHYEMQDLGFNYRITDFQCALGIQQLKKLNGFIKNRKRITKTYYKELSKVKEIDLPIEKENAKSAWHLYVVRLKNHVKRKETFDYLRNKGIGVQVHYIPVHFQPYYRERFGYKKGDYPKAEKYYERAVSLPLFPTIKYSEIKRVIKLVKDMVEEKSE